MNPFGSEYPDMFQREEKQELRCIHIPIQMELKLEVRRLMKRRSGMRLELDEWADSF